MQAFCMKCRKKREMKDPTSIIEYNNEEQEAGDSGRMPRMWNKDVQDR